MKFSVKLPVIIRFDNTEAIFMANHITTTSQTKNIDIRYKYVNEYVEDGVVKIIFVKSSESDSIILTKNLNTALHENHSKKMVGEKLGDVSSFKNM